MPRKVFISYRREDAKWHAREQIDPTCSFNIRRGELHDLAGLAGAGRTSRCKGNCRRKPKHSRAGDRGENNMWALGRTPSGGHRQSVDAGFNHVILVQISHMILVQIGPDQQYFFDFSLRELAPRLRERMAA
jgi:hypothetical protein